MIGYHWPDPILPGREVLDDLGPGSASGAVAPRAERHHLPPSASFLVEMLEPATRGAAMNSTESRTLDSLRMVLGDSVERSVRMARASDEARAEDDPLADSTYLDSISERSRPAVCAAAQRLRSACADGDRIRADAGLSEEAIGLLHQLPRGWELPRLDPTELAARIPG